MTGAPTIPRTFTVGTFRLHANRTAPDANPLFMVYPLFGKRGLLVTVWRRRFELRW